MVKTKLIKNASKKKIIDTLLKAEHITLTGHTHPDADSIGSCLAVHYFLKSYKKKSIVISADSMPKDLKYMLGIEDVHFNFKIADITKKDVLVVLDSGDMNRIGEISKIANEYNQVLFIDHHKPHNLENVTMRYVDQTASATAEIVADIFSSNLKSMNSKIATILYTAISSDTGGFAYPNTTSKTLRIASKILERNVDLLALGRVVKKRYDEDSLKVLVNIYKKVVICDDKRVGYISVGEKILGIPVSNSGISISECVMCMESVVIGFVIRENKNNFSVSLRSRCEKDIRAVAEKYNGGGHPKAAGFEVSKKNYTKATLINSIYENIIKLLHE